MVTLNHGAVGSVVRLGFHGLLREAAYEGCCRKTTAGRSHIHCLLLGQPGHGGDLFPSPHLVTTHSRLAVGLCSRHPSLLPWNPLASRAKARQSQAWGFPGHFTSSQAAAGPAGIGE